MTSGSTNHPGTLPATILLLLVLTLRRRLSPSRASTQAPPRNDRG
jgi:hypothetical protein